MARTDTLGNFLTDVCDAVREKTGETGTIKASELDTKIANLSSGSKYAPKFVSFKGFTGTDLTEETTTLDTSNMTDMGNMFSECASITSLDLSKFNVENVTNCGQMFYSCTKLETVDFSNWNTPNLTRTGAMFSRCNALKRADMSSIDGTNVTVVNNMFYGCSSLEFVDIRGYSFEKITQSMYYNGMFSSVPTDCLIIVKDDAAKTWVTEKFTTLTNVKTVAEYEAE